MSPLWVTLFTFLFGTAAAGLAQGPMLLEVGRFSAATEGSVLPEGWKPLTFKKVERHTQYEVVKDGSTFVVKAVSEASASGLTKDVTIDLHEYPIVRWRWKVENLLRKGDVNSKAGDDYPARLYITFAYEPDKVRFGRKLKYKAGQALFGNIPIGALNYIWDGTSPIGTIVDNAFTDFAKMIVVESGPHAVGTWVEEERNVYADYRLAFGEEPPAVNGVAIMSDTDNTKEHAVAYYGDIVFVRASR
ncbi:MAG: uncharacterized protein K0S58_347 [Nitrospira sp.]|jgi:hypothetical protein|nr:uncharacterized protein [Nitrospira sp.]